MDAAVLEQVIRRLRADERLILACLEEVEQLHPGEDWVERFESDFSFRAQVELAIQQALYAITVAAWVADRQLSASTFANTLAMLEVADAAEPFYHAQVLFARTSFQLALEDLPEPQTQQLVQLLSGCPQRFIRAAIGE